MKLRWKKHIKINRLTCERGSSSVLVIMVMLLLITFGVLAMMSSYSNLKIARKHAQWTSDYYQLSSIADSDLKSFEQLFEKAKEETEAHFTNQVFNPSTVGDLPINPDDMNSINTLKDQIFLYHLYDDYVAAPLFIRHDSSNFDYEVFTKSYESTWIPEVTFITQDSATKRKMLIKIAIDTQGDSIAANAFSVIEWRELPKEFEYDETIDFVDPEGN